MRFYHPPVQGLRGVRPSLLSGVANRGGSGSDPRGLGGASSRALARTRGVRLTELAGPHRPTGLAARGTPGIQPARAARPFGSGRVSGAGRHRRQHLDAKTRFVRTRDPAGARVVGARVSWTNVGRSASSPISQAQRRRPPPHSRPRDRVNGRAGTTARAWRPPCSAPPRRPNAPLAPQPRGHHRTQSSWSRKASASVSTIRSNS